MDSNGPRERRRSEPPARRVRRTKRPNYNVDESPDLDVSIEPLSTVPPERITTADIASFPPTASSESANTDDPEELPDAVDTAAMQTEESMESLPALEIETINPNDPVDSPPTMAAPTTNSYDLEESPPTAATLNINADHPAESPPTVPTQVINTNDPAESRVPVPTSTPNGSGSMERTPAMPPRRGTRRRRIYPRVECPYNLRSKRRRLSQNGQSTRNSSTAETVQVPRESGLQDGQAAPRAVSQTSIVRDSQSGVEQPQDASSDDSHQENEEEAAEVIYWTPVEVVEAEAAEIMDAEAVEVHDEEGGETSDAVHVGQIDEEGDLQAEVIVEEVGVNDEEAGEIIDAVQAVVIAEESHEVNDEEAGDASDEDVVLVSHTRRDQATSRVQAGPSTTTEPDTTGTAAEVPHYGEPRFVLEEYRPLFCWTYKTKEPHCAICMGDLESFCPSCEALENQRSPSDPECKITWGKCSHVFHDHCLQKWFEQCSHHTCPLDRQVFEVDRTA